MNILQAIIFTVLLSGCVVVLFFYIYGKIHDIKLIKQVTSFDRGEFSERRAIPSILETGINPKAVFHDLYLQKADGTYTQIDMVAATKSGLIVFEIKDYSGWIFGNGKQKYWTQILNFGKEKHRFYNPIMQNNGHIVALRQCLQQNPDIPIYSVIVFYGDSELKSVSYDTPGTYIIYPGQIASVVQIILNKDQACYGNKHEIMDVLTKAVDNGKNQKIRHAQIASAQYYSRNKPRSSYNYFPGIFFRGRFW